MLERPGGGCALKSSALQGTKEATLFSNTVVLATELGSADMALPNRRQDVDISQYSLVRSQPLLCYPNAPLDFELVTIPHRGASHQERAVRNSPQLKGALKLSKT